MLTQPESAQPAQDAQDSHWLEVVQSSITRLPSGSIQIIIHDGKVTQVDSISRTRFDGAPKKTVKAARSQARVA